MLSLTRTYINPLVKLLSINARFKGDLAYTITYLESQAASSAKRTKKPGVEEIVSRGAQRGQLSARARDGT